jgi:hypothetical protein
MRRCSSIEPSRADATGLVNAPGSGVTYTSSTVAQTAVAEERLGQERELQRRDRALDRHVDDVHHEPSTLEAIERVGQRGGAVDGVEVEDAPPPPRVPAVRRLVGSRRRPGRDDQVVVGQAGPVREHDHLLDRVYPLDVAEHEVDAVGENRPRRLDQVLWPVGSEWDEQQPRLVEMLVGLVDDGDLPPLEAQPPTQLVRPPWCQRCRHPESRVGA